MPWLIEFFDDRAHDIDHDESVTENGSRDSHIHTLTVILFVSNGFSEYAGTRVIIIINFVLMTITLYSTINPIGESARLCSNWSQDELSRMSLKQKFRRGTSFFFFFKIAKRTFVSMRGESRNTDVNLRWKCLIFIFVQSTKVLGDVKCARSSRDFREFSTSLISLKFLAAENRERTKSEKEREREKRETKESPREREESREGGKGKEEEQGRREWTCTEKKREGIFLGCLHTANLFCLLATSNKRQVEEVACFWSR